MPFDLLRAFVGESPREVVLDEDDHEVTFLTSALIEKRNGAKQQQGPSNNGPSRLALPVLRKKQSTAVPPLLSLLHQTRQDEIGGSLFQVLSELNSELQLCASKGERLEYDEFCLLRSRVSRRLRRWLTTKIFLMLRDDGGTCDIHALYDYFYSVGCMVKTRLTLQSYQDAEAPLGQLREQDVEKWIIDLYPSVTIRSDLGAHSDSEFQAVYTAAATRAFFFFLDPRLQGRVSIDTLVSSPITDALLEVTLTAEEGELIESWHLAHFAS